MPIVYRVHPDGVVRAVLTEVVRGEELVQHALELGASGCLAIPLLLDARAAVLLLSAPEIAWLADMVGGMRRVHGRVPVAFLTDHDESYDLVCRYAVLMEAHNPRFAVFRSAPEAEAWVRPPAPPELIGWARVHPAHTRRALRLDPNRWYPVVERPADVLRSPLKGYVWLDDGGRYRHVWAAVLEILPCSADGVSG